MLYCVLLRVYIVVVLCYISGRTRFSCMPIYQWCFDTHQFFTVLFPSNYAWQLSRKALPLWINTSRYCTLTTSSIHDVFSVCYGRQLMRNKWCNAWPVCFTLNNSINLYNFLLPCLNTKVVVTNMLSKNIYLLSPRIQCSQYPKTYLI